MNRFPTAGHLASWARFAPGVKESAGKKKGTGATGHGNRYLARILGEAAIGAARTDTFLGERYRRIARRRGPQKAMVAVGRSILLSRPGARFRDCSRPVSPDLSPNPPCASRRNGLSTVPAVRLVQLPRGWESWCRGSGTG